MPTAADQLQLKTFAVSPRNGNPHTRTLIYLHGFCGCGEEYLDATGYYRYPWRHGAEYAPGLRVVLPTAPRLLQPWGEVKRAWYAYCAPDRNAIGNHATLTAARGWLVHLLQEEIAKLHGAADKVFIGGISQGCTVALDLYMRHAPLLGLGGFVGSVGFVPSDMLGFKGADAAMQKLLSHSVQKNRPVWLQCATDDDYDVPWRLVRDSLGPMQGKLPGLVVRTVQGRGHLVDDWEINLINEFLHEHACDVYY